MSAVEHSGEKVMHDNDTDADLIYRKGVYVGFVSQHGDDWSASAFDRNRCTHTHLGFHSDRAAALKALGGHR